MSTLRTLHDAFAALEERADAARASHPVMAEPDRRRGRVLAPAGAAATVLALVALTAWLQEPDPGSATTQPAASRPAALTPTATTAPTATAAKTTAPKETTTKTAGTGPYDPPTTQVELAAKATAILAGTGTIVVTGPPDPPGQHVDAYGGAAITGTLTAAGQTGGFMLNVYRTRADRASCAEGYDCTVRTLPDGTSLAIGVYGSPDAAPAMPGSINYSVDAIRPDRGEILLNLSTERDPKGESEVIASRLPLTVQQMIEFVTSDRW